MSKLTPMQEFINVLTENRLISINQTLIDGALKEEKKLMEQIFDDGAENVNYDEMYGYSSEKSFEDYYNEKFKN